MEPENKEISAKKQAKTGKGLKPIMITGISYIIDFKRNLSEGGECEFEAKISANNLRSKMRIIEHLKQNKIQFYIIPDREIPIKILIRGFPTSTDID